MKKDQGLMGGKVKTKERILITVRTYPTPSGNYIETVCTGGITDSGEWRRLYPIPFRYLETSQQFRTYDVIEVEVKTGKDGRPETRTPVCPSIKFLDHLDKWESRSSWIDKTIFESLEKMKETGRSIGAVAAKEIISFDAKKTSSEFTEKQKQVIQQGILFEEKKPLEKIPFEFRFRWKDEGNIEHNSLILAWEFSQTWRSYREKYSDPIGVMRDKWMNDICGTDKKVSFFMGNIAKRRHIFMVVGVYGPPKDVYNNGTLF